MKNESEDKLYHQLAYYTLSHGSAEFIHQNIVDAYAAQNADENTKPVKVTFALIGLYLLIEKGYTGRQVQLAHIALAKKRKDWPHFDLPKDRGELTVRDVLDVPAGAERDQKILEWCKNVWEAYTSEHRKVVELVRGELDILEATTEM